MQTSGKWNRSKIVYVTGGTTKEPRLIYYTDHKWNNSVAITAEILGLYGINENSRILIAFPSSPWAIGQVFSESSRLLGGTVFPIGLNFNEDSFYELINEFRPTHICATARSCIKWALEHNLKRDWYPQIIFSAGEKLDLSKRKTCSNLWTNTLIVDIYGMAEFDTLGAQLPNSNYLTLVPKFEFAILKQNKILPMSENEEGELLVRSNCSENWFRTRDFIRVISKSNYNASWTSSWDIEIIKRTNESIKLSDGTLITIDHLIKIKEHLPVVNQIQVIFCTRNGLDVLKLCFTASVDLNQYTKRQLIKNIKKIFINSNVDLVDSINHNVIKLKIMYINDESFIKTKRGKIPAFVTQK